MPPGCSVTTWLSIAAVVVVGHGMCGQGCRAHGEGSPPIASGVVGGWDEPDVARPHAGVKAKLKLCMRCRHWVDVGKEADAFMRRQSAALGGTMRQGMRAKAAAAAAEAARAEGVAQTGDPFYGTDPNDPARVRQDGELRRCLALPLPTDRDACMDRVRGDKLHVPDPSSFDPSDPRYDTFRQPAGGSGDVRGLDPNPTAPFIPADSAIPPTQDDLDALAPPFTHLDEPAGLLETGAHAGSQDGGDEMEVPLPPPAYYLGKGVNAGRSPQKSATQMIMLADMVLCVNEPSRQFVYSLFRGVVGRVGEVECVDDSRGGLEATAPG